MSRPGRVKTAAEFDRGWISPASSHQAATATPARRRALHQGGHGQAHQVHRHGEALDKLEEFRPEGLASRILGFGDIVGLMKDFEGVVDEKKAEEDAEKILTGNFDLHDFVEQIKLVKKMGSVNELLEKFPLFGELPEGVTFDDKELHRVEAIISSMTRTERKNRG